MDFSYSSTQQSIVTSIENIMANFDDNYWLGTVKMNTHKQTSRKGNKYTKVENEKKQKVAQVKKQKKREAKL